MHWKRALSDLLDISRCVLAIFQATCEAAILAMSEIFNEEVSETVLLIDASNALTQ